MTVMTMNYNNPALEAELAYRRERLAAQALGSGRHVRWFPRRRRGGSAAALG
jgi:hypothetical protein